MPNHSRSVASSYSDVWTETNNTKGAAVAVSSDVEFDIYKFLIFPVNSKQEFKKIDRENERWKEIYTAMMDKTTYLWERRCMNEHEVFSSLFWRSIIFLMSWEELEAYLKNRASWKEEEFENSYNTKESVSIAKDKILSNADLYEMLSMEINDNCEKDAFYRILNPFSLDHSRDIDNPDDWKNIMDAMIDSFSRYSMSENEMRKSESWLKIILNMSRDELDAYFSSRQDSGNW